MDPGYSPSQAAGSAMSKNTTESAAATAAGDPVAAAAAAAPTAVSSRERAVGCGAAAPHGVGLVPYHQPCDLRCSCQRCTQPGTHSRRHRCSPSRSVCECGPAGIHVHVLDPIVKCTKHCRPFFVCQVSEFQACSNWCKAIVTLNATLDMSSVFAFDNGNSFVLVSL